jgi:hypothetical protein
MSATALFIKDAVVHVPVREFFIDDGCGAERIVEIMSELAQHQNDSGNYYVEETFTLRTRASRETFKRKLKMACVWSSGNENTVAFTMVFSGRIWSGWYDFHLRQGWFNLD